MADNITITFPDGNTKKFDKGVNGFTIAKRCRHIYAQKIIFPR